MEDVAVSFTVEPGLKSSDPPRIDWGEVYPMVPLGEAGTPLDLGRPRTVIDPIKVNEVRDMIVFAELGGGLDHFFHWWRGTLEKLERPYVVVRGDDWSPSLFQWHVESGFPAELKKKAEKGIAAFGNEPGSTKKVEALKSWGEKLTKPFNLTLRNLTALGPDQALEAAIALRKIRERGYCPHLQVLVAGSSESIFMGDRDVSGYRTLCCEYRLPSLTEDEILELARHDDQGRRLSLDLGDAIDPFIEQTGGRPLLVQSLLQRLRELAGRLNRKKIGNLELARAAKQLRDAPPNIVKLWQDDLLSLLKKHRELGTTLNEYVLGKSIGRSSFPPPVEERPLFIAGWVGLNRLDRWAITSQLHAHLARPMLDQLKRGGR